MKVERKAVSAEGGGTARDAPCAAVRNELNGAAAAEHSWDCPCHGSRFSETGRLLNNPANDDLDLPKGD